ncbi:hypothetical protein SAMN05421687_12222 [Salimicrobium flavidum]|uniref:Uncharacterized protein n=1 Tax=Salimicrobium flavidum TaxID=570947 RepID=A0A1N7KXD7_9BACI|nr:hypothetical protein SAMN05421687_12222 [Salimicrobium flavidum]
MRFEVPVLKVIVFIIAVIAFIGWAFFGWEY